MMETKDDFHRWLKATAKENSMSPYGYGVLDALERYEQFLKDQGEVVAELTAEEVPTYHLDQLHLKILDSRPFTPPKEPFTVTVRRKK